MGVYIELPKEWAKWSLEVTDVHDNILEVKTTDIDLVRCGECKHRPIKDDPDGENYGFNIIEPTDGDDICPCLVDDGWYSWMPEDNFYCGRGERRADVSKSNV